MSSWSRNNITASKCNFVHNDEIWKDHVSKEYKEHRSWPNKWGYLLDYYRKQLDPLESKNSSAGSKKSSAGHKISAGRGKRTLSMHKENDKHSVNLPPIMGASHGTGGSKMEALATKRTEKAVTFPSIASPMPGGKRTEGRKSSDPTDELEGTLSQGSKIKLPRISTSTGAKEAEDRGERFPQTTAGEIGWKWKRAARYGSNQQSGARRRKSMRKSLDWPRSFM